MRKKEALIREVAHICTNPSQEFLKDFSRPPDSRNPCQNNRIPLYVRIYAGRLTHPQSPIPARLFSLLFFAINAVTDATPERVLAFPTPWGGVRPRVKSAQQAAPNPAANPVSDPVPTPISEEDLLARVQARDDDALATLFDRFARTVAAVAYRILRDRGEAEEIVQEVFLYLHRRSELFDPARGTARTFIKQVAYSRALDRREYLVRRQFYSGTDLDSAPDRVVGDTDLERDVTQRLHRAQLRKAFDELPQKQRQVLEMYYFEGMNLREISEHTGDTLGNVRHHYYRGIEQLRKSAVIEQLRDWQP